MKIESTTFGAITIDGTTHQHDAVVRLSGEVVKRKKKLSKKLYGTSHVLSKDEAKFLFENGCDQVVIGSGQMGHVHLSPLKPISKQRAARSHRVSLTPAGETLLRLAGTITKEVDRAKEEMARLDGKISGRVSIGMITSAAQSTLAASSAKIAARYPEIQLLICEGYTDSLIDWVLSGELDIAIINMPLRKIPLTAHHILDEEMMLARGTDNKLQFLKTVSFKWLKNLDLVIPSRRHGLRMILDNAATAAGFILKPRLEVDTLSAVCEIVATTEMVTVLPGIALNPLLSAGRIRAQVISRPAISRSVSWVTNPRRVVSGAAAAVVEIISADLARAAKVASGLVGG